MAFGYGVDIAEAGKQTVELIRVESHQLAVSYPLDYFCQKAKQKQNGGQESGSRQRKQRRARKGVQFLRPSCHEEVN